jgi:hypothetical protein
VIALVDRALALNPSYARGWCLSGLLRHFAGQFNITIEHVETSLRLSPRESVGTPLWLIGEAYFFKRQFDLAEANLLLAIQEAVLPLTALSPRAMRIWAVSTKRAQ